MTQFILALPTLTLFLLGYLLKKVHYFKKESIVDIKKFITNISLPALLFNAFLTLDIQVKYTLMIVIVYLMCLIMIFIGKGVRRVANIKSPYFPLMMSGFEMGMFGYTMFISFYGVEHLGKIAFLVIGQSMFVFSYLISAVTSIQDGEQNFKTVLKKFFTSPIILSIAAGIIVGQFKQYVEHWSIIESFFVFVRLLGSITIPLITIMIGYGISIGKEGIGLSLFTIFVRKSVLLVLALLINTFIIDQLLHMDELYQKAMLIMVLSPPTFILSILALPDDKENFAYINRTISLDCLVSIFITTLVVSII